MDGDGDVDGGGLGADVVVVVVVVLFSGGFGAEGAGVAGLEAAVLVCRGA